MPLKDDWANGNSFNHTNQNDVADEVNARTFPVFRVSEFYGGTLGGSDDTTCIQSTLDACRDAGGGIVFLPSNDPAERWKAEQLTMHDGVHFRGAGWSTYALDGFSGGTKLEQLTGVNDDFIIFDRAGATQWVMSCGISDMSLRGAVGSTTGHAISIRDSADTEDLGTQDLTTFERIYGVGFAGSVIKVGKAAPFSVSNIAGIGNGGYVIEIVDAGATCQVLLKNISGDGNMGYDTGFSGAVVYLNGIDNPFAPAVSIFGVKSEYRVRESSWPNGDGTSWGNFNAVIIEDCTCPITITGVSHTGYHPTVKPGNAIQIIGPSVPDLMWQSVHVAAQAGQVTGDDPSQVYDAVNARGTNAAHGYWGPTGIILDRPKIGTALYGSTTDHKVLDVYDDPAAVNLVGVFNTASGSAPGFYATGSDTNVGFNFTTQGTGIFQVNSNPVGVKVAVPSTATSTGVVGQWAADSSFFYVCTATNTWRRVAVATW